MYMLLNLQSIRFRLRCLCKLFATTFIIEIAQDVHWELYRDYQVNSSNLRVVLRWDRVHFIITNNNLETYTPELI